MAKRGLRPEEIMAALREKQRWSAADGRLALACVEESGLTIAGFASKHDLDPWRLYHWRARLSEGGRSRRGLAAAPQGPAFLPVRVVGAPSAEAPPTVPPGPTMLEVELRGQRRLRVPAGFPPEAVARLVFALEGGASC
jgi:transposase-like protein